MADTTLNGLLYVLTGGLLAETPTYNKHNSKSNTFLIEKFMYFYYVQATLSGKELLKQF